MPIELDLSHTTAAKLRVVGVGGAGGNAVNTMITRGLEHVEFIAANTDSQALMKNPALVKIKLGSQTTRGLGAGANPDVGRAAIEESLEDVRAALEGSDMVFVTAGMGGGTGTGAAPVVARIAREQGALVVAIVTKPFSFENKGRMVVAENGIKELRENVDALIVIPNDRIMSIVDSSVPYRQALEKADEVLLNATKGIADIILREGIVNVDFADVVTVMRNQGDAMMGIGTARGERRAIEAAQNALNSPILEGMSIFGAKGLLVNISGDSSLTLVEVHEAVSCVQKAAGEDANIIHGVVDDESCDGEVRVTVVATGFTKSAEPATSQAQPSRTSAPSPAITILPTFKAEQQPSNMDRENTPTDAKPSLSQPNHVDTSDIEVPAIWRREKQGSGTRIHTMPATRNEVPLAKQDEQAINKEAADTVSRQTVQAKPEAPSNQQPEAFPRTRVKVGQASGGSNSPSFLRKIMD